MPTEPYTISGVVRKGPRQGYSAIASTINTEGGEEINLSVSSGSELATSQTITLEHSSGNLTTTTNDSGQYEFNLANLSSYTVGDEVTVILDTRTTNTELQQFVHVGANARKIIPVDKTGNAYDENYPFPITISENLIGHAHVLANVDTEWTRSGDNPPTAETITFPNGERFRRTMTYTSNGAEITRSKWVKI